LENGETTCSSCLFCDKILKTSIETYLKLADKRLNTNEFRNNRGRGGGRGRGGRGRGGSRSKRSTNQKEW